jgi:Kinesin-associated
VVDFLFCLVDISFVVKTPISLMLQSLKPDDLRERLEESEKLMNEMEKTWEDKLKETERIHMVLCHSLYTCSLDVDISDKVNKSSVEIYCIMRCVFVSLLIVGFNLSLNVCKIKPRQSPF